MSELLIPLTLLLSCSLFVCFFKCVSSVFALFVLVFFFFLMTIDLKMFVRKACLSSGGGSLSSIFVQYLQLLAIAQDAVSTPTVLLMESLQINVWQETTVRHTRQTFRQALTQTEKRDSPVT